jgi:hypothetical protein
VDEAGGEVGEECLEVEALLQFRPQRILGPRHRANQRGSSDTGSVTFHLSLHRDTVAAGRRYSTVLGN